MIILLSSQLKCSIKAKSNYAHYLYYKALLNTSWWSQRGMSHSVMKCWFLSNSKLLILWPQQKFASNIDNLKLQKFANVTSFTDLSNLRISRKKPDICLLNKILSKTLWNCNAEAVVYPGILFGGGVQQIQLRTEDRENDGGGSPLVRVSGGSCNLVQEISFHIVKFS